MKLYRSQLEDLQSEWDRTTKQAATSLNIIDPFDALSTLVRNTDEMEIIGEEEEERIDADSESSSRTAIVTASSQTTTRSEMTASEFGSESDRKSSCTSWSIQSVRKTRGQKLAQSELGIQMSREQNIVIKSYYFQKFH